ncbi:hypothetical protein EDF31_11821 [Curtobacterium sp. PhB142]|uniref:hypothetical protein n=1 Tax=unclassified Curtobacterium TaxID=257496 RepID=UPI00104B965B|nr:MULTISPECIES: hypothetical protein [unclassified Curtobacterium]TCL78374.1 hypothetical protein EDF31_11821 [Curtobacterium sp. PhB142]TCL98428.1 hypothetical protein EDF26_11921 [Curtobacterium sp. PhB134]TCU42701.1 hypothetical protein EDF33_11223 [Curtobacterium sp. PhB146]TDW38452.1 hypothetical protein EDF52_1244 [Curtobacterium sp. PhB42]TDW48459.1 hypothetical protein EDF47_1214 [Curtobacterium sp. PhB190]
MSILLHHPKTSPALSVADLPTVLRWAAADEGFWVADNDGAFAGTIDQHGRHFFVRNGFGEYLGDYHALTAAQTALDTHTENSHAEPPC